MVAALPCRGASRHGKDLRGVCVGYLRHPRTFRAPLPCPFAEYEFARQHLLLEASKHKEDQVKNSFAQNEQIYN